MNSRSTTCLIFAAGCLAAITAAAATGTAAANGRSTSWSAQRNVVQSHQYDRLLETNLSFRKARMRKECGPIGDAQLRQDCLASFGQDEPFAGSSTARRHYPSGAGR